MDKRARRLERLPDVIDRTGKGRTSIYNDIRNGTFPKQVRIGDRSVAWDSEAIDKWIEKQIGVGK